MLSISRDSRVAVSPTQPYGWCLTLALQLHSVFQVRALCSGLMGPPPERPSNDMGRLNAPLRKPCGDAANFLRRSVDEGWLCFRIIDGGGFLGRQSLLARYFLQFRQIGIRIAA